MALSTFSELKTAVADWLHRSDLTSVIPDFITLAEADLQVRAKLREWDTSASVTITSGSGSLPSDFAIAASVTFGSNDYTLEFLEQNQFDKVLLANPAGTPMWYTIRGSNLLVAPSSDGTATLKYTARFTALSDSATTNSLLTKFPDAYLNGALAHACAYLKDDAGVAKHMALFDQAIARVKRDMMDSKYPQGLQMRVV